MTDQPHNARVEKVTEGSEENSKNLQRFRAFDIVQELEDVGKPDTWVQSQSTFFYYLLAFG
jgi:hypothetical protein